MTQKFYTFTVSEEQLGAIVAGLNELPRKFSQPVLEAIQRQIEPPTTPNEAPAPTNDPSPQE